MRAICEWGQAGAEALLHIADVFIVVDVLSFTTCVDVACSKGASILPFPIADRDAAVSEAQRLGVPLAGRRSDREATYSLSTPTLQKIPSGTRLMLPSPNGSQISFSVQEKPMLAGCLRNARAVAQTASELVEGGTVAVIPAGERWPDGSLRPAIEDLLGSGAILSEIDAELSPEAQIARNAFLGAGKDLIELISASVSGCELTDKGFADDVTVAVELNSSDTSPILVDSEYRAFRREPI